MANHSRTRDSTTVDSVSWSDAEYWEGNPVGFQTGTAKFVQPRRMLDNPVPRFSSRSRRGEIFVNKMVKHEESSIHLPGKATLSTNTNRYETDGIHIASMGMDAMHINVVANDDGAIPFVGGDSNMADTVERLEALAITKAYGDVGKADIDLLTELAELKETLTFLWSPVKAMVTLTRRFRNHLDRIDQVDKSFAKAMDRWLRSNPKTRGPAPKGPAYPPFTVGKVQGSDIASAWLAYRYGLMPLIYTFQDAEKLLASINENPTRATARGKEADTVSLDGASTWRNIPYGGATFRDRFVRKGEVSVKSRAGVLYAPDWSLNRRLGNQLHRVPIAMYEVIPLSFVSDWMHNGVDFYNALTAELRAQSVLGAWVVTTCEYHYTIEYESEVVSGMASVNNGVNPSFIAGKWQRRRPASLADIRLKLRLEMNGKRIADALALIYNFLVTSKKPR